MKLLIKNMVCPCCAKYVGELLTKLGLTPLNISASTVTLDQNPTISQLQMLDEQLKEVGLEIVFEKKNMIVEKMKSMIRQLVNDSQDPLKVNLSTYLSEQLSYNYSYLSNLFSETEGMTIRNYCIDLRIERVKRMLAVENLDLLEITCRMNYSSAPHLAAQFKKVTGLTTTEFKRRVSVEGFAQRMAG
jgi:YesN/AraC family two-component response regulator